MKINKLNISGFRSHSDTTLDKMGKLVLILGPNGSGKSGIVDAIAYLFTGACRGTDDRGAGSDCLLAPAQEGRPAQGTIIAETDKGLLNRMVGQGAKSLAQERIIGQVKLDRQSLRCALRSQAFLDMETKEQESLLRSLAKTEVTEEQAAKALGVSVEGIKPSTLTTMDGVLAAYQFAYGARTALKKQLEEASKQPGAPEDIALNGASVAAATDEVLADMIAQADEMLLSYSKIRQENQKLDWLRGERKTLEDRVAALKAKIAPYPPKAELLAKIKELETAAREEENAAGKRREQAADWLARANLAQAQMEREQSAINKYSALQSGKAECSTCGQTIDKLKIRGIVEDLQKSIRECEKARDASRAAAKKLDDASLFPGKSSAELAKLRADVSTCAAIREEGKAAVARIAEIDKLLAQGPGAIDAEAEQKVQVIKTKLIMHQAWRQEIARADAARNRLSKSIDDLEAAVKALSVGGPVRALHMGEGFKEVIDWVSRYSVTLGVGEVAIVAAPKWSIAVNGRSAELLSASERWRVSLAFAAVIAKKTGVNLVCVDGADILDEDMRNSLMSLAEEDDFDQIIITATSTLRMSGLPGWSVFCLTADEKGVSRVLEAATA